MERLSQITAGFTLAALFAAAAVLFAHAFFGCFPTLELLLDFYFS